MIVGFTGTREGPTPHQHDAMRYFLRGMPMTRFVHGGAIHCDTFAHTIVVAAHDIDIEIHPATVGVRSSVLNNPSPRIKLFRALLPLQRNRVIVRRIHGLLAVPATDREGASGTWATVRYARELGLPIYIVKLNGRIVRDPSMDAPL